MVAAEKGDAGGVADFEADEEGDRLDAVVAAVDVVPEEEVVCVWTGTSYSEQLEQVVELAGV